jgi:hypothetical protein
LIFDVRFSINLFEALSKEEWFAMNFKHLGVATLALLLSLSLVVAPADAKVKLGVDAASTFQSISTTDNFGNDGNEEMGFGDPRGNLHIHGDVAPGVEAYMEVLLNPTARSSKVDNEGDVRMWQGYLTLTDFVPGADLKMGNFEPDFGAHREDVSVNGRTMNNEFVTNGLVTPITTETGLELSGAMDRFAWSAAVTNGMESDGMGNVVSEDSSLAHNLRIWGNITPNLTTSLSYYASDQSDADVGGGGTDMFGDQTPNSVILSDTADASAEWGLENASPQMNAADGDITAFQFDLGYEAMGNSFNAYYGIMEDGSENISNTVGGNTVEVVDTYEWDYYSLEFARDLTPQTYLALRYGAAEGETELDATEFGLGSNINSEPEYTKYSVGLGHQLNPNTLAKLEYLQQESEGDFFNPSAGVESSDAEFSGIIAQLAVSF